MLLQGKKLISSQQVAGYAILTIALIIVFCHYLLFISNPQLLLLLDNCLCARVAKAKWITSVKRNR
jgi:hypothetical protein